MTIYRFYFYEVDIGLSMIPYDWSWIRQIFVQNSSSFLSLIFEIQEGDCEKYEQPRLSNTESKELLIEKYSKLASKLYPFI